MGWVGSNPAHPGRGEGRKIETFSFYSPLMVRGIVVVVGGMGSGWTCTPLFCADRQSG